ncbi:cyclic nucleotide-binding domain-containing protein [Haliangium sp.]|uniref:cyclic nucleotide-binding domain-containing protein n=1 Tax=Haliangium sp. TaxID=2663208 RepID=UPI003D13A8FD
MARRDTRTIKDQVAAARDKGKLKQALKGYIELEQIEPDDGEWSRRAAEMYRRLGKDDLAVSALERAADKYVRAGFLVKAIAACKMILQIDPSHSAIRERLSVLNAERTGVGGPAGTARAPTSLPEPPSRLPPREPAPAPAPAPVAAPEPDSDSLASIDVDLGHPDDDDTDVLGFELGVPEPAPSADDLGLGGFELDGMDLGPMDLGELELELAPPGEPAADPRPTPAPQPAPTRHQTEPAPAQPGSGTATGKGRRRNSRRTIPPGAPLDQVTLGEVVPGARQEVNDRGEDSGVFEIPLELEDSDIIEIDDEDVLEVAEADAGLGEGARRALRETPLLSSLGPDAMQRLIDEVVLVQLEPGQVLFREGDMGDALYVVADGSVSVMSEGPPRVELSNLGEGSFFGEIALVTDQVRNATIEAHPKSGAQLLAIARNVISDLVEEEPAVLQALLRFLRDRLVDSLVSTSPLFAPFAGDERQALASRFRFLEAQPGAVVLEQGVKASGFFILLAGRLEAAYRDDAGERILGTLDSGDMFGELSLLSNIPAEVTVRATAKSFLLELRADTFREVIMTHPQVLMVLSDLADARQRELDRILAGGGDYPPGNVRLV